MIPLLRKEARALLPTFAATAATVVIAWGGMYERVVWPRFAAPAALLAFVFGSAILPAHSIGHEYGDGTLGMLLAQPVHRRRLLTAKLMCVIPAVALLGFLFYVMAGLSSRAISRQPLPELPVYALLLAFATVAAPVFTMIGRTTLAGSVLTIAATGALWVGAGLASTSYYGVEAPADADALQIVLFRRALLIGCLVAGALTWRMFDRLQAVDGTAAPIDLAAWLPHRRGASATTHGSPARALRATLAKELRLQQLSFVLAAIFAVGWAVFRIERPHPSRELVQVVMSIAVFYAGTLSLIAGGVASADERQLGMHASQLLLPWPSWLLWTIKVVVLVAVVLLLGVLLPLAFIRTLAVRIAPVGGDLMWFVAMGVATCALYVSSCFSTPFRAMVATLPLVALAPQIFDACRRAAWYLQSGLGLAPRDPRRYSQPNDVVWAAVLALVLALAYSNHRRVDRSAARIAAHAIVVVAAVILGFLLA